MEVAALDKRYKELERKIAGDAERVLGFLRQNKAHLEVYLVSSARMRALNLKYRGKDRPTNVLSFPSPPDFPKMGRNSLGEVYLCPSYIKRQREDILTLLVHGILHLLGFNHESRSDRMIMEKREKEVLTWLNH